MQPSRTFLFVPGNHPRKLEKVFDSGADAVIIDLEDAVAIAEKPATRAMAVEALKKQHKPRGYIRVNALDTEFCFQDFHNIIGPWLDGIVLPKVESATDYLTAEWMLSNLERDHGVPVGSIDLMPIIETAKGLAAAREIASCGKRIKRLSFGAGDYTRDLNLQWTFGEDEIMSARQEIVLASRLADIEPPIDTVFIHIKEHEHFAASAQKGREFGFQGKLCIHPNQVEASHAAYTPTQAEAEWAQKIIDSFEEAEKAGSASIQVDGYFVDYPIVEKAERIVELYQAVYGNQ